MTDAVVLLQRSFSSYTYFRSRQGINSRVLTMYNVSTYIGYRFLRVLDVLRILILEFPGKSLFVILPHRSWTRDFDLEGKRSKIYPELTTLTQNNAALTRAPREQGESSG
jgi:hypothetical protein